MKTAHSSMQKRRIITKIELTETIFTDTLANHMQKKAGTRKKADSNISVHEHLS